MRRLLSCFLFQTRPGDGLSKGRRTAFWCWNALVLAGCGAALGLLSLVLAPGPYGWALFWDYFRSPALAALNLLPPAALIVLLYGLTGRAWLAYLLTALPVLGLSFGSYYKLTFRDDPVIAADLLVLGEAGKMAGQYRLFLTGRLAAALLCALLGLGAALLARGRPRAPFRAAIAAGALAVGLALAPACASDELYEAAANPDQDRAAQWSATQQYVSRGLLYPFLHSIRDAAPHPPKGYDQRRTAALLAEYEDEVIPEDKKVNIVGVMLEAFADFSVYDQIQFRQDVYALYHRLEAESYSGRLVTNIFAGGTVDTERAFLTGMAPANTDYRARTSSYVWYLKSQGYRATGDHPSNGWFYNRINVNAYLGFDQYRFSEDCYTVLSGDDTAPDAIFFPTLTDSILEQLEDDEPLFSFSVSYQGHGPYADGQCWWGNPDDYFAGDGLDASSRNILANYFGSVMDTQVHLMGMVDALRAVDEPVVLVVFGDHKPWLGNNASAYAALGIDLLENSLDAFYSYWSTSYLIWANDAARAVLGTELEGDGPDISPCFLMNLLFDRLGWKGDAYMQAADECWRTFPMIHREGLFLTADGELVWAPSDSQVQLIRSFRGLEYYRSRHFIS